MNNNNNDALIVKMVNLELNRIVINVINYDKLVGATVSFTGSGDKIFLNFHFSSGCRISVCCPTVPSQAAPVVQLHLHSCTHQGSERGLVQRRVTFHGHADRGGTQLGAEGSMELLVVIFRPRAHCHLRASSRFVGFFFFFFG